MQPDNRRDFLKLTALGALVLLPCSLLSGQLAFAATSTDGTNNIVQRDALLGAFDQVLAGVQQFWTPEFGPELTRQMLQQARSKFAELVPNFPDVGGARNWDSQFIPIAAWYVALYVPMKAQGKSAEDVGHLVYRIYQIELAHISDESAKAEGDALFTPQTQTEMKQWADWTQQRSYPANWVARFVPGDGQTFDYGYDYSECGLVKYFKSQGVAELAPYMCLNDFIKSARIGSGLVRTTTIAQGDKECNFRYLHGRTVVQNWETEIALIRSRQTGSL
jgi:hypothetical protein